MAKSRKTKVKRIARVASKKASSGIEKTDEGKTLAIVSYLTCIGLLIAVILNNNKRDRFARFHIRQSLLIMIGMFATGIIVYFPLIGRLASVLWGIFFFVLWVMGLVYAIRREEKEVCCIGKYAQEWFSGL